jgi:hypothetical protein
MAVSDRKRTKNLKTQTIRKLMNQQGGKIMLLCVLGHVIYHRQRERRHRSQRSPERANTMHRKIFFPRPHNMDWTETSKRATRKMEQYDNRDEEVQTTTPKLQTMT